MTAIGSHLFSKLARLDCRYSFLTLSDRRRSMDCTNTMHDLINSVTAPTSSPLVMADGVCDGTSMARRTGRPVKPPRGIWRAPDVLTRRVRTIVGRRDDEQSVTDVGRQLIGLARRIVPRPLTESQRRRLLKLAPTARPSRIVRTLLSWRFELSDRAVRAALQRHIPGRVDPEDSLADILMVRWG